MEKIKKWGRASARLFAPLGTGLGAVLSVVGGLQSLTGFNPVGGERLLIIGLMIFAVFGAWVLIGIDHKIRENDAWLGNEYARALWRDGIPAVQEEYLRRVRQGDYGTVNRFWQAGFVDPQTEFGRSALHLACEGGHAAVAQGILERGGDPKRPDRTGLTPLMFSAIYGHVSVAQKLFEHDCALDAHSLDGGSTALHIATCYGHLRMVDALVHRGAQINAVDHNNVTPLMAAFARHKWDVVEKLLHDGADTTRIDAAGATLVDYANAFQAPERVTQRLRDDGIIASPAKLTYTGGGFASPGKTTVNWQRAAPA